MAGMILALTRRRPPVHDTSSYETALRILIQPSALVIRQFNQLSTESIVSILALNSLLWGIVVAAVIALFRRRRRKVAQTETSLLK